MHRVRLALLATVLTGACRPATRQVPVVPAPFPGPGAPRPTAVLPPIPLVEGPLAPRVVYPQLNQFIQSRDSTFILGSVGNGKATLTINGQPVPVQPNGAYLAFLPIPPPTAAQYELVAVLGADTVRSTHPVRVAGMTPPIPDSLRPPPPTVVDTTPTWVILGDSVSVAQDTDRVIIGRPGPNETYRWFLFPGTRVQLTGFYPGYTRIRLDSDLQIWVLAGDARTFARDTTPPRRVAGNARVRATPEYSDFIIPIAERPAYFVEEKDRSIELTLYDTRGNTDLVNYPTSDALISHIEWTQERSDRVRYAVHLDQAPFGYLVLYENNALVLRVRRKPGPVGQYPRATTDGSPPGSQPTSRPNSQRTADSSQPNSQRTADSSQPTAISQRTPNVTQPNSSLNGLTIAVDPGHPPGGATGPTGFYEADAALAVGVVVERLLQERGARVVMTRTTRDPVDLQLRPTIARRANAHALVSLHYNAYADGQNPLRLPNGTETYFFRAHSEPLAREVQAALAALQPLPDQGVHYRSLALVRWSWMPSILVEGGFIIVPEQENAMRTEAFQERYARAVVDGLEAYFRKVRSP
ncbi:MAG TPA: N-acetylmuramoyl-L-alanine amidase [Gemmatimonadaceae bacterium]|nr:N-acetylmuramoyl-L-alanine amidase [Gemmatimonadaceae bacterium]